MTALFSDAPEGAYVTLTSLPQQSLEHCNMQQTMMAAVGARSMPDLTLPENSTSKHIDGVGHSEDTSWTNAQLETTLSSIELLVFLGSQLAAQQWQEKALWSAQKVSGSAWISADEEKSGLLHVISLGDDEYKLGFRMVHHR